MQRDVADFIEDVTNEKIAGKSFTGKTAAIVKDPAKVMQPVYDFVEEQLNLGKLGYGELKVSDADAVIRLETNLINLPLQEPTRISKMISDQEQLPVNVYLVMTSPHVNQSGLRIDEVASADDFIGHVGDYAKTMNDWVAEKLAAVQENIAKQAETEAKEAENKPKKAKPKSKK
ncbi:hypothetical protein [Lentilactobacillus kisonensis]|uniref:Uncharacterized protein n=2 Tax=Lentilactobacillus kisonensis TaxID=481722 RepID=H1LC71_9LACO|nr:hypothetical protein [Lentilactobacillus kisonensis]EHO54241.1 hypothetical protein HMPREF9104_00184 [Lentilactobacillus kisonensis F0435]KRL20751.1 hypothetical protein FC98_GL001341 [Lentilactobacillus kisonensis DSM 19906 = JCM 15041]